VRHLEKALTLKTDEERLVWFNSLTPDEQVEFTYELQQRIDMIVKAFQSLMDAIQKWSENATPLLSRFFAMKIK
jgi:hypothetical protein